MMTGARAHRWALVDLVLALALAGCSDSTPDAAGEWATDSSASDDGSGDAPAPAPNDDGRHDDDGAPDPDGGPAPGTTGGDDDTGSNATDDGTPGVLEWCRYDVVAVGEIQHLNVHAEPDPTSPVQFTLKLGESVWGSSTVVDGYRDLDRDLTQPRWADATRLVSTGECEIDDGTRPEEVPLPQGFELPFECGQLWRLDSWGHAPALDMVREPDQHGTDGATLRAPAPGVVNQSYYHNNAGNLVQIDHGGGWYTTFIHMQSRAVEVGDVLERGDTIGAVGATGPTSNGHPHLHFELGVDADGDGQASWGFAGAERVNPWFHGVEYGQSNGLTWRDVESFNCP